jgi:hypothetical protein
MNVIYQRCETTSRRANRLNDRRTNRARPPEDARGVSTGAPGAASHADPNGVDAVNTDDRQIGVRENESLGSPI